VRIATIIISIFVAVAFVGNALAVGPGKTVEYAGGSAGKVIFKGDTHGAKQGMKCNDCHPKPFGMKKGMFKMTQEDHGKADNCGICHDGKKAFSQSTEADCGKCHMKAAAEPEKKLEAVPAVKPEEVKPEAVKPEAVPGIIKEMAPAVEQLKK
jgi:c(7)-type cytochrome triheme protein